MFNGYVQQSGMYETLDLIITDYDIDEYKSYYENTDGWYLTISSENLKDVICHLWFVYNGSNEVQKITMYLEQEYIIEKDTIAIMFAEKLLLR